MPTPPPTSTTVSESAVIASPLSHVWHLIKLPSFHTFWSKLKACEEVKGASPETDIVKWTFIDGGVWEVKLEEWSVSSWEGGVVAATEDALLTPTRGGCLGNRPPYHLLRHLLDPAPELHKRLVDHPLLCGHERQA